MPIQWFKSLLITTILLARVIGWEAAWAEQDRRGVASVIRYRMIVRGQSLEEVLYAPGQFSTAYLLDRNPPDMTELFPLAIEALQWDLESLPVQASHFWSPTILSRPPYWADSSLEVIVEGTVHRFYCLEGPCYKGE